MTTKDLPHKEALLICTGANFPLFEHRLDPPSAEAARFRSFLLETRKTFVAQADRFEATLPLKKLYDTQRLCCNDAECATAIANLKEVASASYSKQSKRDEMTSRIARASMSALTTLRRQLDDLAKNNAIGKELQNLLLGSDRLLAGAAAIEAQIEKAEQNGDVDPDWKAKMEALVEQKKSDAKKSTDTAPMEEEWHQTPEYQNLERFDQNLAILLKKYNLQELFDDAMKYLNSGKNLVASGAEFEKFVAENIKIILEIAGYDYDWFLECEKQNKPLPGLDKRCDGSYIDQSKTEFSLHCLSVGKPNLRTAYSLSVYEPTKSKNKSESEKDSIGEIDGIVYDASTNQVLIWIEMKAHAPDITKADKQRSKFFNKIFNHDGCLTRSNSKTCWFGAKNFELFKEKNERLKRSFIVSRHNEIDYPIAVPSHIVNSIQKAVWCTMEEDSSVLEVAEGMRFSLGRAHQRCPKTIIEDYEKAGALDRLVLLDWFFVEK